MKELVGMKKAEQEKQEQSQIHMEGREGKKKEIVTEFGARKICFDICPPCK